MNTIHESHLPQLKTDLGNPSLSNGDIATKYGCSRSTIVLYRKELGIPHPKRIFPKSIDVSQLEIDLANPDMSNGDVAAKYGRSESFIFRQRLRLEIPHPSRRNQITSQRKKILDLCHQGFNASEISRRINIKLQDVKVCLNNHGFSAKGDGNIGDADRSDWQGFYRYWQNRQWHFRDLYGVDWGESASRSVSQELRGAK